MEKRLWKLAIFFHLIFFFIIVYSNSFSLVDKRNMSKRLNWKYFGLKRHRILFIVRTVYVIKSFIAFYSQICAYYGRLEIYTSSKWKHFWCTHLYYITHDSIEFNKKITMITFLFVFFLLLLSYECHSFLRPSFVFESRANTHEKIICLNAYI